MISEIDFTMEHLYSTEKDFRELLVMVNEKYEIECENAEKHLKAFNRNLVFHCYKYNKA